MFKKDCLEICNISQLFLSICKSPYKAMDSVLYLIIPRLFTLERERERNSVCVYIYIYIYIYMCVCVCVCVCPQIRRVLIRLTRRDEFIWTGMFSVERKPHILRTYYYKPDKNPTDMKNLLLTCPLYARKSTEATLPHTFQYYLFDDVIGQLI